MKPVFPVVDRWFWLRVCSRWLELLEFGGLWNRCAVASGGIGAEQVEMNGWVD